MKSLFFSLMALQLTACGAATATGGEGTIVINELQPSNKNGCKDAAGDTADWAELYNPGETAVDLGGWFVSNDPAVPKKQALPAGLLVPAKGFLQLWADGLPGTGADHLAFKLKASGAAFVLSKPDGSLADQYAWKEAPEDVSYARVPDGTGPFFLCVTPTCGGANASSCAR